MNGSGIFLVNEEDGLVRLNETTFDSEDDFQTLLERYPDLIPGDQIDPDKPRRWLHVSREASIPDSESSSGRWALDHLFVDQDGIPTFVEVKRRSDSRLRREVVAQMLDYAANAMSYWTQASIYEAFEATAADKGQEPARILDGLLDNPDEQNEFWERVWTNLQAGKLRLLFVADQIPVELQRVIEFLNDQMNPAEVLGVELRLYAAGNTRTLVPRLVGRTAHSSTKKQARSAPRSWDAESMVALLREQGLQQSVEIVEEVMRWAETVPGLSYGFGTGAQYPTLFLAADTGGSNAKMLNLSIYKDGLGGYIDYANLLQHPPFDDVETRRELQRRFLEIDPNLDQTNLDRSPTFSCRRLSATDTFDSFKRTVEWVAQKLHSGL